MPTTILDLGDIRVASTDTKHSLLLASSMTLDIPSSIDDQQYGPDDFAHLTRTGRLWIAKADKCRFAVAASAQGLPTPGLEAVFRQQMVGTINDSTVWEDLGLTLRKEPSEPLRDAYTSFVVNHPDLSSESLSPAGIPCTKILAVTCDISYHPRPPMKPVSKPTRKPANRQEITTPDRIHARAKFGLRPRFKPSYAERDGEEEEYRRSRQKQNLHVLQSQDSGIGFGSQDSPQPERGEPTAQQLLGDAAMLTDFALKTLLGVKKRATGVRVRDPLNSSLMDIAPSVFNIRYLQAVTRRAEHIPWIASCLASLDPESPSLRLKLQVLTEENPDQDAEAELEKRLHMLMQSGLDVSPMANSKRPTGARASQQRDGPSQQEESALEDDSEMPWSQDSPLTQQLEDNSLPSWSQDTFLGESQEIVGGLHGEAEEDLVGLPYVPLSSADQAYHERQQFVRVPAQQKLGGVEYEPRQPFKGVQFEQPQLPENEWLKPGDARYFLDENGQRIEDLGSEVHAYGLIPLDSDDQPLHE